MPYAHHGDVEIFFETFGEPTDPALLLVNGLGSQCINYRVEWCERFVAEGFFVIRFDNRDVGLSTKFSDVRPAVGAVVRALSAGQPPEVPYTLDDMAGDAIAVLDHLEIEQSHVMGVSMGGMIVQQLAIRQPERLLSMTSVMSTTGDPAVGGSSREAQALMLSAAPTDRVSAIARHLEGIRTYGSPACYDEERLTAVAGEAFDRSFTPDGQARQVMAIIASPDRTVALHDVHVPTLVMHGDADTLVDISGGRSTADAIPGARFVVMEGMGHDYPPQYWERWVQLVTDHARSAGR
ncbi:MAG: alpha/beta fold hydrolase [Actinomycetota bacterium]|nr:alpha/beta fold hydrolase [Actinomycetota bacterium]